MRQSVVKKTTSTFRHIWRASPLYRLTLRRHPLKQPVVIPTDPWPGDIKAGRFLLDGKFLIEGESLPLSNLWMPKNIHQDGLSVLHQFNWLRDLRALGDNSARRLARQLITHWIEQNQNWNLYPWRVEVTGHRIANWIALYDFFCSSAEDHFRLLFLSEMGRQIRHLAFSWQGAVTPLERFYALKGLIYAAVTFPENGNRLEMLLPQLEKELQAQTLPDGGHNSRQPQTHLTVLRDLIDIRAVLRLTTINIPLFLQTSINQMVPIVRLLRHGDGGLATFGANFEKTSQISSSIIDMVLSLSDVRGRPPERAPSLGFERCAHKKSLLLLNVGKRIVGNPPKGIEEGTGSLNFEWSIGRDRLIVQGDLILQTPEGVHFQVSDPLHTASLQFHRMAQGGHFLIDVSYGYLDSRSFYHRRQIYLAENQTDLRGNDMIRAPCDALYGIRFILAKGITAFPFSGKRAVLIEMSQDKKSQDKRQGREWRFLFSGAEEIQCDPSSANQTIFLLGPLKSGQPAYIQWSFQQD